MQARVVAGGLLLVLLVGCEPGEPSISATVVRDSAGVEIIEHVGRGNEVWRVADRPALEIGVTEGKPPYQFHNVRGARRLADGTFVIADGGSREIRFFDGAGQFVRAVGRRGGGPGEFEAISRLETFRGDSIVVFDWGQQRATVFDPGGKYVRDLDVRALAGSESRLTVVGSLEDGTLVSQRSIPVESDPDGYNRGSVEFLLLQPSVSKPISLGIFPGTESFERRISPSSGVLHVQRSSLAFARSTRAAAGTDRVYIGSNDTYEVRAYRADGSLERVIRRIDIEPRLADAAMFERYIEEAIRDSDRAFRSGPPPTPSETRDRIMALPRVPALPTFADFLVDDVGALWIRDYSMPWESDEPSRWAVFDSDGRLITVVETPATFQVYQIGSDFVLGLTRGELDTERVQLYGLVRSD